MSESDLNLKKMIGAHKRDLIIDIGWLIEL